MFKVSLRSGSSFPTSPDVEIVEERRDDLTIIQTVMQRVMQHGRSMNMGLGEGGNWHLRRRQRQVQRDYSQGLHIAATSKEDHALPRRLRFTFPWWWI